MDTISKNLEALLAFQTVAETKSFTQAAERLGKSKSFLSKQVIMLETYLGTSLFLRTTRNLSLTEEGRALLNYGNQIFKLSQDAEKHLKDLAHGLSGSVKISAPLSLGFSFFPSFLTEASKKLPNVRWDADFSNANRDLMDEQIDFAIRATPVHAKEMETVFLGRIQDAICVAPETAKKIKNKNSIDEVTKIECIQYSHEPSWNLWDLNLNRKRAIRFEAKGRYSVNLYEAAKALCLDGKGIARLPRYSVQNELKSKTLVELFSNYEIESHPLYLIHPKSGYTSQKHQIAKALMLKWFQSRTDLFKT